MKAFSDTRTTIEQERLKNATFVLRVELWRQYPQAVSSVDTSTNTIVVPGDATPYMASNDVIMFPLVDFNNTYLISSISYNPSTGNTTITLDVPPPSTAVGKDIARRYVVSYGDTERLIEMSPIRFSTEGEALNEFTAGDVTLLFDNGDGFFSNRNGTGIFDSGDVFWIKIFAGYKGSSDRILFFGGILDLTDINDDRSAKTIQVTAYSHEKELERYPAFLISEPLGRPLKLRGITLLGCTPSAKTVEGERKLKYRLDQGDLPGVTIVDIDKNTPEGIRSLKFRVPDQLRYHDGAWTTVAENTQGAILTDASGLQLKIDTSTYDVQDREVLLKVVATTKPEIAAKGVPKLSFDNGLEEELGSDFVAIYRFDGANYSDETPKNELVDDVFIAFAGAGDILYLFANTPFYGVEVEIESSTLNAVIAIEYSIGFNSWQSIGSFTDGTSNFTQTGAITWDKSGVSGWRPTTVEFSGVPKLQGKYAIRLKLNSYVSGSATLVKIGRRVRLFAADDTILDVQVQFDQLSTEDVEETIILRQISGVWTPCMWWKNLEDQKLIELALQAANFDPTQQQMDQLIFNTTSPVINIWGEIPYPFYGKRVTALAYDSTNSRFWFGIENELWYLQDSQFFYVGRLTDVSIYRLTIDNSGNVQGLAWWDQYDKPIPDPVQYDGFKIFVFRANTGGFLNKTDVGFLQKNINPVIQTLRKGKKTATNRSEIGAVNAAGENIILPFPQMIKQIGNGSFLTVYDADTLLGTSVTVSASITGPYSILPPGHYKVNWDNASSAEWVPMRWRMGNQGFVLWDSGAQKWIVLQWERNSQITPPADTNIRIVRMDYSGTYFVSQYNIGDSNKQPICGFYHNNDIWIGMMEWNDQAAALSTFKIQHLDLGTLTMTILWDSSVNTAANSSQSVWGQEGKICALEMAIDTLDTDTIIHGCFLNRETFEYHYFVLHDNGSVIKLYSTQTGNNFTFDKHRQIKDFVFHNGKMYAVVVDTRYREESAYLIEGTFDKNTGAITLNKIDVIDEGDYDHVALISDGTDLYGITGKGVMWQFSQNFRPRTELADLSGLNVRQVITEIARKMNMIWTMRSDRKLVFLSRTSFDGDLTLHEDKHIVGLNPLRNWDHAYDGIVVDWRNEVRGQSGKEQYGTFGWDRRILTISGKLINNRHIARVVAQMYGDYFLGLLRKELEAEVIALIQAEERDRIKLLVNSKNYDVDRNTMWYLHALELDPETLVMKIKGVN